MKTKKKIVKTMKYLKSYYNAVKKRTDILEKQLKNLWLLCFIFLVSVQMCSCGTTKISAAISQPKDGSRTTITINTNTPITTDIKPDTEVEFKK